MSSHSIGHLTLLLLSLVFLQLPAVDSAGINAYFHFRCHNRPCPSRLKGKVNLYWSPEVDNDEDIIGPNAKVPLLNIEGAMIHSQEFNILSKEERVLLEKPTGLWEMNMEDNEKYHLLVMGKTNAGTFYVPNSQFQRQMAGCVKESRVRCQFHFEVVVGKN